MNNISCFKLENIIDYDLEKCDLANTTDFFELIKNYIYTYNDIKHILNNIESIKANKNIDNNIIQNINTNIRFYRKILESFYNIDKNQTTNRYNILIEEANIRYSIIYNFIFIQETINRTALINNFMNH